MNDRAAHLVRTLGLGPHPEGGLFSEVFRSEQRVRTGKGLERRALTSIYFLLAAGQKSRWHRVAQDEVWHFYEGEPLDLWWLDPGVERLERRTLSPVGEPGEPMAIVPAGAWQAARPQGGHALVGCVVGPGFETADFALMIDHPETAMLLRERFPDLAEMLQDVDGVSSS
jgi:uncharacterized protein